MRFYNWISPELSPLSPTQQHRRGGYSNSQQQSSQPTKAPKTFRARSKNRNRSQLTSEDVGLLANEVPSGRR